MAQPANLHSKTQQSSRVLHPPVGQSLDRWRAFEHNYSVGQIGRHDKVVFHHKSRLLGVKDKSEQRRMTLITWTLRPLTCSTIFLSLLNSQVFHNSLTPGGHLWSLKFRSSNDGQTSCLIKHFAGRDLFSTLQLLLTLKARFLLKVVSL